MDAFYIIGFGIKKIFFYRMLHSLYVCGTFGQTVHYALTIKNFMKNLTVSFEIKTSVCHDFFYIN